MMEIDFMPMLEDLDSAHQIDLILVHAYIIDIDEYLKAWKYLRFLF